MNDRQDLDFQLENSPTDEEKRRDRDDEEEYNDDDDLEINNATLIVRQHSNIVSMSPEEVYNGISVGSVLKVVSDSSNFDSSKETYILIDSTKYNKFSIVFTVEMMRNPFPFTIKCAHTKIIRRTTSKYCLCVKRRNGLILEVVEKRILERASKKRNRQDEDNEEVLTRPENVVKDPPLLQKPSEEIIQTKNRFHLPKKGRPENVVKDPPLLQKPSEEIIQTKNRFHSFQEDLLQSRIIDTQDDMLKDFQKQQELHTKAMEELLKEPEIQNEIKLLVEQKCLQKIKDLARLKLKRMFDAHAL